MDDKKGVDVDDNDEDSFFEKLNKLGAFKVDSFDVVRLNFCPNVVFVLNDGTFVVIVAAVVVIVVVVVARILVLSVLSVEISKAGFVSIPNAGLETLLDSDMFGNLNKDSKN